MSVKAIEAQRLLCLLFATVAALLCGCATGYTVPDMEITLVDATNGRPVADANLLFYVSASQGSFTGHGGASTNLFFVETVSDASGIARFPANRVGKSSEYNLSGPFLLVYAKGYQFGTGPYAAFPSSKREILEWMDGLKVIRMRPATNDEERAAAFGSALGWVTHAVRLKGSCCLRNIPRFLETLKAGLEEWNARTRAGEESVAASRLHDFGTMDDLYRAAAGYRETICAAE